jgi:glycosyltransferase involved in cell wall biosynthesis
MKISLVLGHQSVMPAIQGGGVETLLDSLSREFARQGHEVTVFCRQLDDRSQETVSPEGVRYVRFKGKGFAASRAGNILDAFLHGMRLGPLLPPADVTSFHTPFAFLYGWRRSLGVTTFTIHRTPKWNVGVYAGMDRVYAGSEAVVRQALAIAPRMKNLLAIHNCVPCPPEPVPIASGEGSGLRFLYVGRFVRDKGIESLIEGFKRSLKTSPGNKLATLGPLDSKSGSDTAFLEQMRHKIAADHLLDKVEFLPPVYDKALLGKVLSEADVICVPTLTGETFSIAILEAMALGRPVLVSDFPPMVEAVEHLQTGFISRCGDPDSIATGIDWFTRNRHSISALGLAGYRKLQASFSVPVIAGKYLEDFQSLARKKTR